MKIDCIREGLESYGEDAALVALKSYEAQVKKRIHNMGMDQTGKQIGNYKSRSWIKKRQEAGRQVGYIDLEMTGELRKGLTTGQIRGGAALGFSSNAAKEKQGWQTDRYGDLWRPTVLEQRNIQERFWNYMKRKMKSCK